jgi:hypothetical protein|nr:MAG TPA: HNH endonuclease bacteriophage, HNH Endonuclease, DNA.52A [Caudoviricetes sp.]
MNKEEYNKALKHPRWLAKRDKIKRRDGYKCVKCSCKDDLHVHHTYYLPDKMPWEVPDDCLITLCKVCHENEHKDRDIKSFLRTAPPKKKPIKKKAKGKGLPTMSKSDKELQNKYNEIRNKGKLPEYTYKPLENIKPSGKRKKKRRKKP